MKAWLSSTVELLKQRDTKRLKESFTQAILQNLKVKEVAIINLTDDSRYLTLTHKEVELAWSVSDFDVPFSHVLQEEKVKIISYQDLIYWKSNDPFLHLTRNINKDEGLLIYPLKTSGNSNPSLLLLIDNNDCLENHCLNEDFLSFLEAFYAQWALIQDFNEISFVKHSLSETLQSERKQTKQEQIIKNLSSTLIGESQVMLDLKKKLVIAAESPLSILIQGETGTGKEVVARSLHNISSQNSADFIAINCAAIPENLLESELFGYEKGAFSGADSYHSGLIEQADGGTLFLDEIGDMPMHLQSKLLRVLETKTFRPLGGKKEQHSNFRLISATHINLKEKVKNKEFRADLYYRLVQFPLQIPKLKDREDDIPLLSEFFIDQYNQDYKKSAGYLTPSASKYLKSLEFHGNVRELKSMIEFACSQVENEQNITITDITNNLNTLDIKENLSSELIMDLNNIKDLKEGLTIFESKIIESRLQKYNGNKRQVAESLGLSLRTLTRKYNKIETL